MALTRSEITQAALGILDAYGLGDLSMRRVAEALGVQAGALYYHVPNKQRLLAGLADEILGAMGEQSTLQAWARAYRTSLLRHRDAAELVASTRATGLGEVDPTALLTGVDADTMAVAEYFVLGATLHDQTQAQLAELGVVAQFDAELAERRFRRGLQMLHAGVMGWLE